MNKKQFSYKEKKGTCIVCGTKGLVSDEPFWWHNEYCYECIGKEMERLSEEQRINKNDSNRR